MNAWPEGAANPRYPVVDWDHPSADKIEHSRQDLGFELFTSLQAVKYPLLARALKDSSPAFNTKIEWTYDLVENGEHFIAIDFNWCQIQRAVRSIDGDEEAVRNEAFDSLCSDMESTLLDGRRSPAIFYNKHLPRTPIARTCGGVKEILGRGINDGDIIRLRCLREPFWRTSKFPDEFGGEHIGEWIVEWSLQAVPRAIAL